MKKLILVVLIFSSILATGQTLVPFLKENGKYTYVEYTTMKPAINQEFDLRQSIWTANGMRSDLPEIFLSDYVVVNKAGKSIIIDKKGKSYLNNFDGVDDFRNGVAIIVLKNKKGLATLKGETLLIPKYDILYSISPNYFIGQIGAKADLIDNTGKIVYPVKYNEIEFMSGKCLKYIINGKAGMIDNEGKVLLPPIFEPTELNSPYSCGLVKVESDGWIGYKNNENKLVIPLMFEKGDDFSEDRAAVQYTTENNEIISGYIDTNGKFIWKMKGRMKLNPYHDGYALVQNSLGNFYIDKDGVVKLLLGGFIESSDEVKSYYKNEIENINKLVISKQCIIVPNPKGYELGNPNDFYEGLARIGLGMPGGNYTPSLLYLDKSGKVVIPVIKGEGGDFNNGFSSISRTKEYFKINQGYYIDKEGREYIENYEK